MADDYYATLGVARNASAEDIRKAYRELARKYHPDMNPDDKTAKKKFQKIQAAFDVLGNPEKRQQYDRFGPGFESAQAGPRGGYWRSGGSGPEGAENVRFEDVDLSDLFGTFGQGGGFSPFGDLFGFGGKAERPRRPRRPQPAATRGRDLQHEITIPLATAVRGGEARIEVNRGGKSERLSVKIPPGIDAGKRIRLRGQGEPSPAGGEPGDLLLVVHVASHPHFTRSGKNLELTLPVTLAEAALGAKIDVPAPAGTVTLTIPPGSSGATRLRIKGQGVTDRNGASGDLLVRLQIALPREYTDEAKAVIRQIGENTGNPRAHLVF